MKRSLTEKQIKKHFKELVNTDEAKLVTGNRDSKIKAFQGSIYTFYYRSATATDQLPVILAVLHNGSPTWKAKNGNMYMHGINLNYVSPGVKEYIIEKFGSESPLTWGTVKMMSKVTGQEFRKYNRQKQVNLVIVDPTKYLQRT